MSAHSHALSRLWGDRRILAWTLLALVGGLAIAAGWYFGQNADRSSVEGVRGTDGAMVLGVTLPDTTGRQQSIAQWKGKVLVVNFWATWCVPCRDEMPEFVKAQREFGDRGLQFVPFAVPAQCQW